MICMVCSSPIEMWHAPANLEGALAHAVCLGESEDGVGRKPTARAESRNYAPRPGELRTM